MLKPIQRDQTVGVISVLDPSIDYEASEKTKREGVEILAYAVERFTDAGSWRRTVKFRDGEKPTVFQVGILPSAERARIEDECRTGTEEARTKTLGWQCFLHGIRDIEGGFDTDAASKLRVDGVEYLAPQWLRTVFCGPLMRIAVEVGTTCWSWNQLGDDDQKK